MKLPLLLFPIALVVGCTAKLPDETAEGLTPIVLQTDWYPQPEHGGFYQALLDGGYRGAGMDVEIRPGANVQGIYQLVATGRVQFSIGTSDNLLAAIARDLPLVGVAAYFQHDPQCVMVHASSDVHRLEDLDGRNVMIGPSLNYVEYLRRSLDIRINVLPLDWSLVRFVADPSFIQQCFVTSEPYYVRQKGIEPRVLPLWESGFDPYRVVYTSRDFAASHPDLVRRFTAATLEGWRTFMSGDRSATLDHIAKLNPQHSSESMAWTVEQMRAYHLTDGFAERGEALGRIARERLETQIAQLAKLDLLERTIAADEVFVGDASQALAHHEERTGE